LVVPREAPQDILVAADHVLILSDTTLTADGTPVRASASARMLGREGELLLINGQLRPRISAVPGRWQRWRLVNACTSRILDVGLLDHPLTLVAVDGNLLMTPVEREQVRLSPGSRADVLIGPSAPGSVPVIARGVARGSLGAHSASTAKATVAVLDVTGSPVASAVPRVPEPTPSTIPTVVRRRVLTLSMDRGSSGSDFRIDGKIYDPDRVDQRVLAGTCEEWLVNNAGDLAHPFHLHVWPFEVLGTSDDQLSAGILQDVVLVPARGWARIRIPFTGHTGRSVFHCHIVDHSDAGMMGTVDVA
jgi:FtsP/CotA-like multicopper oxidase with cupredoxin domain